LKKAPPWLDQARCSEERRLIALDQALEPFKMNFANRAGAADR
jgi:hypothetical protein